MLNYAEIMAKYKEYYKNYANQHIDDYETFVRTRVIEYFFQFTNYSIDKLTSIVNATLDEGKNESFAMTQSEIDDINDGIAITIPPNRNCTYFSGKTPCKKLLIIMLLIVTFVGGLALNFHSEKKNWYWRKNG